MHVLNGRQLVGIHDDPDAQNACPIGFHAQDKPDVPVDAQAQSGLAVHLDEMQRRAIAIDPRHEPDDELRDQPGADDGAGRGVNATAAVGRPCRVGCE